MECPFNVDDGLRNHPDYTVREKKARVKDFRKSCQKIKNK
jgi:hypothetical protein